MQTKPGQGLASGFVSSCAGSPWAVHTWRGYNFGTAWGTQDLAGASVKSRGTPESRGGEGWLRTSIYSCGSCRGTQSQDLRRAKRFDRNLRPVMPEHACVTEISQARQKTSMQQCNTKFWRQQVPKQSHASLCMLNLKNRFP